MCPATINFKATACGRMQCGILFVEGFSFLIELLSPLSMFPDNLAKDLGLSLSN